MAHTGVVFGLAGLFFGLLAWFYHSPYGFPMSFGGALLLLSSGAFGWYYGFRPLWRPRGWEDTVAGDGQTFVVFTQQYPPYISRTARRESRARFGTAVYPLVGEEIADEAHPLYGMQWRVARDAEEGHRWVVHLLREGKFEELEAFRVRVEQEQ
ncbi:MAG: hypothetical protein NZ578_06215 [Candidatus Binatia bacterium]|nr:hypothetical protein [Candidatus Binatia bacterium]